MRLPWLVCIEAGCRNATCQRTASESSTPTCGILADYSRYPSVLKVLPLLDVLSRPSRLSGEMDEHIGERAIIAAVCSHPRVTAAARRLPKYGLQPGLALDIIVNDETGQPYDFSIKSQRIKAEALLDE